MKRSLCGVAFALNAIFMPMTAQSQVLVEDPMAIVQLVNQVTTLKASSINR